MVSPAKCIAGRSVADWVAAYPVLSDLCALKETAWVNPDKLPFAQEDITSRGHAIECRINAENPALNFRPSPGQITALHIPGGPGIRVDSSAYQGYTIPPYYDSMIAKLIVHAAKMNREGKQVHEIIASLKQPKESKEIRIKLTDPDFKAYGAKVLEDMKAKAEEMSGWTIVQPNYEGLRVSCTNADEDGWWLLRMSLHDPVMPLNIESNVEGGVEAIERKLKAMGLL